MQQIQHPGLLEYKHELDACARARLQRSLWDDRQVCDENRYNAFAPSGPHFLIARMYNCQARAVQHHAELDRKVVPHTAGDRHGECSSQIRTHRNFAQLCAERNPMPRKCCSEIQLARRAERQLTRDLALEEKAQQRLRQRRERQQLADHITTSSLSRSLKARQRHALLARRDSQRHAVTERCSRRIDETPTESYAQPPFDLRESGGEGDKVASSLDLQLVADCHNGSDAGPFDEQTNAASMLLTLAVASSPRAIVKSNRATWESHQLRFGPGSDLERQRTERQRIRRTYIPSMSDQGTIYRVPVNKALPGKDRLSRPRCEQAFLRSLRNYPSPRTELPKEGESSRFRRALWPADRCGGRMPWKSQRAQAVRI